jgi:Disulphide bond corrector protein DsbC
VTPVLNAADVKPGSTVAVLLKVKLPKGVHVQADKPKDPSLIATALTIDPPAGVVVETVTYPPATELSQQGRPEKLLVFGPEFEIEARLRVDTSVAPGELVVPGRLRYQACNDTMCFAPARADAQWRLIILDSGV